MKEHRKPGMWHLYKQGGITPAVASMFGAQNAQQMAFIRSVMKDQRKDSLFDIPLKELEVVVFDLETTGFSPYQGDEIISFGAVTVIGQEIKEQETFYSLVNPKRVIPAEIERLTGITNQMVVEAPDIIEVLQRFLEFVEKKVLIAHGSGHDKQFLNAALWRTSRTSLTHRLIDTMMIARWLDAKRPSYCLDSLLKAYEIPVTTRHHALQDSLMTAHLWVRFMQDIAQKQIMTMGDLYSYLSKH
jgi:DNA polymerase-3 subunit epsilon